MADNGKTFGTAAKRWEGIGPYYAMFPIRFADAVIKEHTAAGDTVLDPFAGRGTAIFSASALGRRGFGVEISPVGWVFAETKLGPAPLEQVEERLQEIANAGCDYAKQAQSLPEFFKKCFSPSVRRFLLAARDGLDWRGCTCDRTLMAILLVYLHGKEGQALSNQMRQTKAMSPRYALKWWDENGTKPPDLDVVKFLQQRIRWRYAKGVVEPDGSRVYLGNSVTLLPKLARHMREEEAPKARLLLTSPPYFGVTNYHYDQWLRLWLLGFETDAYINRGPHQGRFTHSVRYRNLLKEVFCSAAKLVADDAVVYVRTSKDPFTKEATLDALREAFPMKRLVERCRPFRKPTQTHLFGDKTPKAGEVDLVLLPTKAARHSLGHQTSVAQQ
ncbi:DNA methyltransferase [Acidithiobacillus sp.]|uniref:DNA methyltransferase n=1 Tax=Acidithiobacillus sp. TaxID=1872118 RepID=UPI002590F526|nr:DNA methyltransferase [Acidithiobacillus sp.]MDD5375842.1 DNA methyltransferase [Acidithiobacillus sp.]